MPDMVKIAFHLLGRMVGIAFFVVNRLLADGFVQPFHGLFLGFVFCDIIDPRFQIQAYEASVGFLDDVIGKLRLADIKFC